MEKVLFIFGTRPEAIKMAPMIRELQVRKDRFEVKICVTGQHREMLDQVLDFFSIKPDYDLNVMKPGQTLFGVTARILNDIEPVIDDFKPDIILVQGDTTTALVGALAGYYRQIDVGHLEAGLRSGNIYSPFPEEANRLMIGKIAKFHFAPTQNAVNALVSEKIDKNNIYMVGNTVIDALLLGVGIVEGNPGLYRLDIESLDWNKKVILVTGHRRESFGGGFESMCEAIKDIAQNNSDIEIVYPVHLNPNVQKPVNRILGGINNVHLIEPLDYPHLLWAMKRAYLVLTDSGGIQEEAPTLGKPVLVMREVTERQEGIEAGTAKLVGTDKQAIKRAVQNLIDDKMAYQAMANAVNPYGDGTSSKQIADILERA
jgi:UDP-N-acetylglucosamine 2-epimerase (non-hydrolysing)